MELFVLVNFWLAIVGAAIHAAAIACNATPNREAGKTMVTLIVQVVWAAWAAALLWT